MRLAALVFLLACHGPAADGPSSSPKTVSPEKPAIDLPPASFSLRADPSPAPAPEQPRRLRGEPLTDTELDAMLKDFDPLPELGGRRLPAESPARPKEPTQSVIFPPAESAAPPPPPAVGALRIEDVTPDGDVPMLPRLSVRFNRAVDPDRQPVALEPEPPGAWYWVGAKNLVFEPEGNRLPMATEFKVTLDTQVFEVRTPPPSAEGLPKGNLASSTPVIAFRFDQAVDPAWLRKHVALKAGAAVISVREASTEEIAADETTAKLAESTKSDRFFAVVPKKPLPTGTKITVGWPAGLPSEEGPLRTTQPIEHSFRTHGPLEWESLACQYGPKGPCYPNAGWVANFSTPIAEDQDLAEFIEVVPEVKDFTASAYGPNIQLYGRFAENTTYRVTLREGLEDQFGQKLAADQNKTIRVGSYPARNGPTLEGPPSRFFIPDPSLPPSITLRSSGINTLDVEILAYTTEKAGEKNQEPDLVFSEQKKLDSSAEWVQTDFDLALYDQPNVTALLVRATYMDGRRERKNEWTVIPTQIGLAVDWSHPTAGVWAVDLRNGSPLGGLEILQVRSGTLQVIGSTDDNGWFASSELTQGNLFARSADDITNLNIRLPGWNDPVRRGTQLLQYTFDDRNIYKPGETLHIKGWARPVDFGFEGDVIASPGRTKLPWVLFDARRVEIAQGTLTTDEHGGYDLDIELPEAVNEGRAILAFRNGDHQHELQIRSFRRAEYEVSVDATGSDPWVVGDEMSLRGQALYLTGEPLPGATTNWSVTASPSSWRAPGWERFSFGHNSSPWFWRIGQAPPTVEQLSGGLDSQGVERVLVENLKLSSGPVDLSVDLNVQDINQIVLAGAHRGMVFPSSVAVGIRPKTRWGGAETPVEVEVIATGTDGTAIAERYVDVTFAREDGSDAQTCSVTTAAEPVLCTFVPGDSGNWQIAAQARDDQGHVWTSFSSFWALGDAPMASRPNAEPEIKLTAPTEPVAPGQRAEVLLTSPVFPATAMISWSRAGIIHTEVVDITSSATVLGLDVDETMLPNVRLEVRLVQHTEDGLLTLNASKSVEVSTRSRELDVAVETPPFAKPGAPFTLRATVTRNGQPVANADVAFAVVDEGVLAQSDWETPNPVAAFYKPRRSGSAFEQNHHLVMDSPNEREAEGAGLHGFGAVEGDTAAVAEVSGFAHRSQNRERKSGRAMAVPMASAAAPMDAAPATPVIRSDFRPDAAWAPSVRSNENGVAELEFTLPDLITRYRVTAVAASDAHFGTGGSMITSELPLEVRASYPRFLLPDDQVDLALIVQNRTDKRVQAKVALDTTGLDLGGAPRSGQSVEVPAMDRVLVTFPATALRSGMAQTRAVLWAGDSADAVEVPLPVNTPALATHYADAGELDRATPRALRKVRIPEDAMSGIGGLEIGASTTRISALVPIVKDLQSAPMWSTESTASRLLSIAATYDVLPSLRSMTLPSEDALRATAQVDVDLLAQRRLPSGGWSWWPGMSEPSATVTLQVVHALVRAKEMGLEVPEDTLQGGLADIRRIEDFAPRWAKGWVRDALGAQAVAVRRVAGENTQAEATRIWRKFKSEPPLDVIGFLLPDLAAAEHPDLDQIEDRLRDAVQITTTTATFALSMREDELAILLASSRRTDAILLDTWLQVWPDEQDLTRRLAEGLLAHTNEGRPMSSQENAWILLALQRYFLERESERPSLDAMAWIGPQLALSFQAEGHREGMDTMVPMDAISGDPSVLIQSKGAGRLYWRLALSYAQEGFEAEPVERGFAITRSYEAVDEPDDVRQDDDGTWHIKLGARVRVTVRLAAPTMRYHAGLVDPFPAGFEPLGPKVKDAPAPPPAWTSRWWWGRWYEHDALRDHQAEAYANRLYAGVYEYDYTMVAANTGEFAVPPAFIREIYQPETVGSTAHDRVVIHE